MFHKSVQSPIAVFYDHLFAHPSQLHKSGYRLPDHHPSPFIIITSAWHRQPANQVNPELKSSATDGLKLLSYGRLGYDCQPETHCPPHFLRSLTLALAIFDLDNTLLAGDSDHAWGEFLVEQGLVDPQFYKQANDDFYQDYLRGTLDVFAYQAFALKPLTRFEPERLTQLHQQFMQLKILPIMLDKAASLLARHRQAGDFLLIITATNRFVTGPIAALLGVDDMLATEPEMIRGRYTGKLIGTPCFQEGKVVRLNEWLKEGDQTLDGSYFYSDSCNDIPLLERVDHPVAVDADASLTEHANAKGWSLISLR
ncbi:MAG: HAD superfamily hydrolase (TIGR01490 family) [Motiliproteus sp.]